MSKIFIHSTASQPMTYCIYAHAGNGPSTPIKEIVIKGVANVADPRTLAVREGAVTEISETDLELLKKNPHFQRHCTKGFLKVMTDESELNVDDLQKRDNSAQLNDYEYAKGLDARVPGSGNCQATCGVNDSIAGTPGVNFKGEFL